MGVSRAEQLRLQAAWNRLFTPEARQVGECWLWPGAKIKAGYGHVKRNGVSLVHRAAWIEVNGPIPDGLSVCHHCDTPACYRPSHLFLGTAADNAADRVTKGRSFTAGSTDRRLKLSDEQVAAIRAEREAGELLPDIAHRYGVSRSLVGLIVKGRRRGSPTRVTPGTPVSPRTGRRSLPGRTSPTHCPQGHPYDEVNAAIRPSGYRWCRACARSRDRRRRAAP